MLKRIKFKHCCFNACEPNRSRFSRGRRQRPQALGVRRPRGARAAACGSTQERNGEVVLLLQIVVKCTLPGLGPRGWEGISVHLAGRGGVSILCTGRMFRGLRPLREHLPGTNMYHRPPTCTLPSTLGRKLAPNGSKA